MKKNMKNKLFLATAIIALAACSDNTYLGDQEGPNGSGGAISFEMSTPTMTRATTGEDAATLLDNNFVVFGFKTPSSGDPTKVFDNYQVNWVTNTAGSTESNSADWEYVGYKNLPYGTTTTNGGTLNNQGVKTNATSTTDAIDQSIKYWDFATGTTYDFYAYSLGKGTGTTPTYAQASALSTAYSYTLEGSQAELGACYISKKNHIATPSSGSSQVRLEFVNFLSKIQLKFFETIPGYSVKDLTFYYDGSNKTTGSTTGDGLKPAIFGASNSIPTGGQYTITFDDNNDPVVTLTSASTSESKVEFDEISTGVYLKDYAAAEYKEATGTIYLGRAANAATATNQMNVLPNSTGATLTLKIDYTLVSRDGTGEAIQVTGKTATVPADFTKWKPNYAYTYIFKITDDKLVPITLDAIVTETEDGSQTTITTVTTPSITTYQKGAIANEYTAGNIYVVVGNGSTVLTAETNANLYTATIESGAAQGIARDGSVAITEAMVENALTKTVDGSGNYVLTDANGKKLTVTPVSSSAADKLVGGQTAIPAADAPGGKELAVNCAKFEAVTNTVYVFEFIDTADSKKYYKVIKVGTPAPITNP